MAAPARKMVSAAGTRWVREENGFEVKIWEEVSELEAYRIKLMRS